MDYEFLQLSSLGFCDRGYIAKRFAEGHIPKFFLSPPRSAPDILPLGIVIVSSVSSCHGAHHDQKGLKNLKSAQKTRLMFLKEHISGTKKKWNLAKSNGGFLRKWQ